MIRMILTAVTAFALGTNATAAPKTLTTKPTATKAVQCKDAKGKFIKCPTTVAKAAAKAHVAIAEKKTTSKSSSTKSMAKCRDAKGRFAKCGTPGAKPA